ncbi:MAG: CBS domain-containing protein [Betaproteobacteria bacterium]
MIVKELMNTRVATCPADGDLASAVATMHDRGCGFLPVVDANATLVGVVTDRDICMAVGISHRALDRISVKEAMSHPVFSCVADENVKTALVTMANHHVRRLPVINRSGHLEGVLSFDDVVQAPHRRGSPTADDIVDALRRICSRRPIEAVTA